MTVNINIQTNKQLFFSNNNINRILKFSLLNHKFKFIKPIAVKMIFVERLFYVNKKYKAKLRFLKIVTNYKIS